ncbi:MAG: sugar ABC transporter permease [Chloroflexi bacterium]|nr:sugar ABC transporter permease [Chloroflexota bacterium]
MPIGVLLGAVGVVLGLIFLADRQQAANAAAIVWELLGNTGEATALRRGGGDQTLAKLIALVVAVVVGVGGVWLFYAGSNAIVERLAGERKVRRIVPWIFVGPALVLLAIYLVMPAVLTIITSFTSRGGLGNWEWALTDPAMWATYRNNIVWLIVGTSGAVGLGLLIAGLFDRVKRESVAKTLVFLPLAISLVGASVIWRFVYAWKPAGQEQYGLLNAVWTTLGGTPVPWIQTPPINTYLMIVILIWLQTGFCMVVLSAAIKGVPAEVTEAAKLDGATERQMFMRVIVPMIKGSIMTVTVTTAIAVLKVFDIVYTLTGGRFDTDVIANQMFLQKFQFFNDGRSAVLAVVLFVAVLPLMILNVRQMRSQGLPA